MRFRPIVDTALEAAFVKHVEGLFHVLATSSDDEAIGRFLNGLNKTVAVYEKIVNEIDEL